MEIITGKMKHIIFHNDETNYYVLTVVAGDEVFTATGSFHGIEKNVKTDFYGEWVEHPKFGRQFSCGYWEKAKPVNTEDIVSYLSAKTVKGIGRVTAKRIVDAFGVDTWDILDNNIERLLEIKGISPKKLERIKSSWQENSIRRIAFVFLLKYGVSYKLADKIYRTYEEKTITIMSANPYKAADDVKGIGFPTADEIAEKMGIEKNSPLRIESGIKYALDQLAMKGHVFGYREQVVTEAMGKEVLDLQDKNLVSLTLSDMLAKKDLGCEMDCIYLPQLLKAENFCAEKLKKLASVPAEDYLYSEAAIRIFPWMYPEWQRNWGSSMMMSSCMRSVPQPHRKAWCLPEAQVPEKQRSPRGSSRYLKSLSCTSFSPHLQDVQQRGLPSPQEWKQKRSTVCWDPAPGLLNTMKNTRWREMS